MTDVPTLPDTQPLTWSGDLASRMVEGIRAFLLRKIGECAADRPRHWHRDTSSPEAYVRSVEDNRRRFRKIIGLVDDRVPVRMHLVATLPLGRAPGLVGRASRYQVYAVRWNVLEGVEAEGLLLKPNRPAAAAVVALPDADWTPEMLVGLVKGLPPLAQFARRLAENGCQVLVPVLIDRRDTHAGIPGVRLTNQPHREFVYRAAYEMGRHIIGYEVQKVLAAVDWFQAQSRRRPVGVIGYGEGGLIAFYAAAADTRLRAAAVSGYFQARESLWQEPIYRNVFGLLEEFGDAELASLVAPRTLVIEAGAHPEVSGPPPATADRAGAAPGRLTTPPLEAAEAEFARAQSLVAGLKPPPVLELVKAGEHPGHEQTLRAFLRALGVPTLVRPDRPPKAYVQRLTPEERHQRQFDQLLQHTQRLVRASEFTRAAFWARADASSLQAWQASCQWYRDYLWDEIIGRLPPATEPANPRTRRVYDTPRFAGYEVVLNVYPEVFAYGILLVPKDIGPGERRPAVVCQHGLEGRPQHVADPEVDDPAYHRFACQLADRGFVTFAPQNPYIGGDAFRVLVRMANPIKQTLYAVIVRQHEQILRWLGSLPFVDPQRIGFYGLSYGGKTAMRIPALLTGYSLSICSADYNEWIWKNTSIRHPYSYMTTGEYEMFEFDLGNTFNYAELSWLILPRPFMVERGHDDGVAPDEWVAYEYARTRRRYVKLGLADRTRIEFFDGPHTIHGVGTFEFLHRHLGWPAPGEPPASTRG